MKNRALGPLILVVFLSLRIFLMWSKATIPPHYYCDSTSHLLIGLLLFKNFLPWTWRFFPLPGMLYAIGIRSGIDILYSPFAINGSLAAIALCAIYDGTRKLADSRAAVLASIFIISVPAFTRLIFSANQEMTAIALSSVAFWCICHGLPARDAPKLRWHLTAIGFLGMTLYARSESIGLLILCALAIAASWHQRRNYAVIILGWAFLWIYLRAPAILYQFHSLQQTNAKELASLNIFQRIQMLPLSLADNWPLNILLLCGFWIFSMGGNAVVADALLFVLMGQGLLLCISSIPTGNAIGELERNLCLLLMGASIPAAIVISANLSRMKRLSFSITGILLILLLAKSWDMSAGQMPIVPTTIEEPRLLGWKLRQLAAHGDLGGPRSLILLEADDRNWPNAVVFSGLQDRFRVISTEKVNYSSSFEWDGHESIGIIVVRSETTLLRLKKQMHVGKLIALDGPFKIYEADVL